MTEWYDKPPMSASKEFLILVGLWLLGLVAGSVASLLIWMGLTGESALVIAEAGSNPKYRDALLVIQSVSSVFSFLFPAVITAVIVSKQPREHLGISSSFQMKSLIIVLLIMTAAIGLGGALGDLNKAIPLSKSLREYFDRSEKQYNDAIRAILLFRDAWDYVIALLVIAILPAIVEEVMFRGSMQQVLIRWFKYPFIGILVTSFIFSAIHFSWYGFLPRMALGIVLGYIFYYTRNIGYSILAHFFNNGLTVTLLYIQFLKEKKINMENEESLPWWSSVLSLLFLIGLMYLLRRSSGKQTKEEQSGKPVEPEGIL